MKTQIRGRFAPIRDFDIEAHLCGELPSEARSAFEAELERSPELREYLAERRRSQAEFLERHPLRLQLPAAAQRRDGSVIWGGLLAAVGLLALLLPAQPALQRDPVLDGTRDTVRVKGNPLAVQLFVKRGETVFRYRPDTPLRPDDRIRISIECPSAGYLSVFGRDARGQISVYYTGLATSPGRYTVPDSLILDDAEGDEQWVVVHTRENEPIERYVDAYLSGRPLATPHAIVHLHKEAP